MDLNLGAVARDTATGVARAWPWLVFAVLFRVAGDLAEIRIDLALTEADPSRQGLYSDSLGILLVREVLDGLAMGVVIAAVLQALGAFEGGRLARGLRAWPTAFATSLIWALPFLASAGMTASASMRPNGIGFGVSVVGSVTLVAAIAALILGVFLGYATGGAVVRGTGVIASFRDSLRLTRGHSGRLLLVSVGLTVFAGLAMYGGNMQSMVPQYLEASLEAFQRNQSKFRDALAGAFTANPFAELARRNMELFEAAAGGRGGEESNERDAEIERLKSQLAELQAKVDKLAR